MTQSTNLDGARNEIDETRKELVIIDTIFELLLLLLFLIFYS